MAASHEDLEIGGLGEDDSGSEIITLVSKDQKKISVSKKNAQISSLIKNVIDSDPGADSVNILGVLAAHLELVVDYMNHHEGTDPAPVEKPLRSKHMSDVCKDSWDADFIDKVGENRQQLYDIILAANYMDIKSLMHLGCAKVASLIKGQPLEKVKDILTVS